MYELNVQLKKYWKRNRRINPKTFELKEKKINKKKRQK
jgi:hypothetical protein